ncbi:MAG: hypothetical protein K0S10_1751 [Rubrobacteraceae bacterium]|nr:hypothetical protein [Rubrobacteraceae bacterium]
MQKVELRIQLKHLYKVRWHVAQMLPRLQLSSDESRIVKTFSMQALAELAEDDASLRARVVALGEDLSKTGGPAMRTRGRKLLDRLNEANQ